MRSRLVVSAGVLDALEPAGVRAVLAHERAHLRERHDLVVLPFVAWGATAPFVRGMVCAQLAVAALIEMRADDVAAAACTRQAAHGALRTMGGAAPAAALSSFTDALDRRLRRITTPPAPLPLAVRVLVRLAALALVAAPTAGLLLACRATGSTVPATSEVKGGRRPACRPCFVLVDRAPSRRPGRSVERAP